VRRLLGMLLLLGALPAAAAVSRFEIHPPRPTTTDEIEIVAAGAWSDSCIPRNGKVTVAPGQITVEYAPSAEGCLTMITDWGNRHEVGRVPAGTYAVVLKRGATELARGTVTVRDLPFELIPTFGDAGSEVMIIHPAILCPCERLEVTIGGTAATIRRTLDGSLIAVVPEHAPGLLDVALTIDGNTYTAAQSFLDPEPQADLTAEHERFLFPSVFEGPGAHGSLWTSENVVANASFARIDALGIALAPSGRVELPTRTDDGGAFLYVPRRTQPWLSFAAHIVDRSRRQTDAGTEMRVVSEEEGKPLLKIVNVPLAPESRQTLRIYDLDALDREVNVVFRLSSGRLVGRVLQLGGRIVCVTTPCYAPHPTFAVLALDAIPELAGNAVTDIDVRAETNDARLWAFVSVTNNDTQHVTTFTPQQRHDLRLPLP